MGSVRRRLGAVASALATLGMGAATVCAQETSAPAAILPPHLRERLATVEDFSFSFAQPGFYAVLKYLRAGGTAPDAADPITVSDWRALLERPADFRGVPIVVEGRVGRNSAWRHISEPHRDLGMLWQIELSRPDQPIACTLILSEPADDIPIGATIRVAGYFVLIRQYYDASNRVRQAALLVGRGPTIVSTRAAPQQASPSNLWIGLIVVLTAGLLIAWLLLRRSVKRASQGASSLEASRPAPFSLADDLAKWTREEQTTDKEQQRGTNPDDH
jgi:hypothetical protein